MKQQIKLLVVAAICCLGALFVYAQDTDTQKVPRWVSDKGYWVVESNINTPYDQTIHFYTTEDVLIYKETISGKKLNLNKGSVKMKLKKLLETVVIAWETNKKPQEERAIVKAIL